MRPLATVPQVAAALSISRSKVYLMLDQGELPWVKIGGARRIKWDDVEKFIRDSTFRGAE